MIQSDGLQIEPANYIAISITYEFAVLFRVARQNAVIWCKTTKSGELPPFHAGFGTSQCPFPEKFSLNDDKIDGTFRVGANL